MLGFFKEFFETFAFFASGEQSVKEALMFAHVSFLGAGISIFRSAWRVLLTELNLSNDR